jgi:anti-sigma factor RsiW
MNFNPDDPRWTAYALGELDPAERARLDQICAADPAARKHVEEIRALAEWPARPSPPSPHWTLRPDQKSALQISQEPTPILRFPLRWYVSLGAARPSGSMIFALTGFESR